MAGFALVCLLASACGGNDDDDGDRRETGAASTAAATSSPSPEYGTPSPTMGPTPDQPTTAAATAGPTSGQDGDSQPAPVDQPDPPSLVLTPVVSLPDPIALVARPGTGSGTGDLYVATRDGRVWLLGADGDEPPEMVLDIGDLTY